MIDYFVDLFTKHKYQWTALDNLALTGLIVGVLIIFGLICFIVWLIIELRKERRYKTCEQRCPDRLCWNRQFCLRCCYYKKRGKK